MVTIKSNCCTSSLYLSLRRRSLGGGGEVEGGGRGGEVEAGEAEDGEVEVEAGGGRGKIEGSCSEFESGGGVA